MAVPTTQGRRIGTVRDETSSISKLITLVAVVVPPLGIAAAGWGLWGIALHPVDIAAFVVMYVCCGLGITVGYHRLFSHKSFKTTPAVRGLFAILGAMTIQGPVTQWVTDHRKHHAHSDDDGDPHSPHVGRNGKHAGRIVGLWWSHMGWLFRTKGMERGELWGRDLFEDPVIRRVDRLYMVWVGLSVGIPFLIGFAVRGSVSAGVETLVWAGLIRIFLFQHSTWCINSVCHTFGRRTYRTDDHSRNVWLLALPSFGEAWHNNHHAFPGSAVHGIDRRQIDMSAWVIGRLERFGLAWDVKRMAQGRLELRRETPLP
jgi:stearoyl-CoA desaturase (delta-9 desaturase)